MHTRNLWGLLAAIVAVAALSIAPALAQGLPGEGGSGVSCDPANPDPGGQTTCTAEGLEPSSDFQWSAEFADGTERAGDGTADDQGVGEFTVDVPDAEGDYTVTVTGTAEGGGDYEESFQGTVGGGSGAPGPLGALPTSQPSDVPGAPSSTASPSESPSEDHSEGAGGSFSGGSVDSAPQGGVATGAGGTASDGSGAIVAIVLGSAVAATAGGFAVRRRLTARR